MNTMLAEVLGIVFTVIGLSLLVNRRGVPSLILEESNNKGLWWLDGCVALVFGALLITFNNSWNTGLEAAVTVFAWLALIKGFLILVFPEYSASFYKKICKTNVVVIAGLLVLILGLFLISYSGAVSKVFAQSTTEVLD